MPKLTYAENPIHPVLNDYPAALVPASVAFDMLHLVTRRGSFKAASFWTLLFATITGVAAAITGYRDYREIPEGTEPKRLANAHAMLNMGVLGALVLQLVMRVTGRVGLFARLLNVAAAAGLAISGWYGTHLVYRHGLRVRGVDPLAGTPEAAPDTGKPFADRLEAFASKLPATDLGAGVRARMDARMRAMDLDADSPAAGDLPTVEDVMSRAGDAR
ncbi:MAG TPA: DUF2231 domain-containing protein [Candidatus Limnocylindrales bacterium]|nr:DUF2231 domain-containing protein [Candidatus Limnocylindrales bacterium]